ncbi:hypothetical protein MMC27_001910 [Xylographa pallens]|nr:hypothetical protein [Xylographa pallens]
MTAVALRRNSSQITNEELDVRVEDYLNDKLQTYADLENLDSLLQTVKEQQVLLRNQVLSQFMFFGCLSELTEVQLRDAETTLHDANQASKAHSTNLQKKVDHFTRQQAAIDRRLLIVTQSETSDDAVQKFDVSMENLRKLDVAKGYVSLLAKVEQLSGRARSNFQVSPQAALQPYLQLQALAAALKRAQPAAEDAAPHLVDHVDKTMHLVWKQMKDAFALEFEETLAEIKWPSKDVQLDGKVLEQWISGVERLLELQEPELKDREKDNDTSDAKQDALVLLPLEVMMKPLEMRFKYHFDGDRATNRLDKPEFFLSHVSGLINTYDDFFAIYLQPILGRHFRGSNLALNTCYINSNSAFITALLPMLRIKVFSLLPQIAKQPQSLSHLMHELMSFDASIRDDWGYDGGFGIDGWKGLTWEVLVKKDWFSKWLKVEKDFALSRYENIIGSVESREIDYDSVDPGTTKPTKAAIRVNDLLETITDRYRPLASFSQKLKFLIDIQIAIFDKFHDRLASSLEAYLTLNSSVARAVQGVSKEEQAQLEGLGGLDRLCRVYGSAEYLEKKMRDWSDDVFFLELWDELQFRARSHSGQRFAGGLSVQDVAERTSSVVGSHDDETGALFDETASAYRRLRIRSESLVQDLLVHNVDRSLRPYQRINPWSSLTSDIISPSSLNITAELDGCMQLLSSYLAFLSKVLAEAPLRRISRHLIQAIQTFLWDRILMLHKFSASGIAQFTRDLYAFWEVFDRYVAPGQGEIGMRRLREAVELMSMPVKAQEGTADGGAENSKESIGIWEVEKRIFRDNESAREVLEELGLEVLTEAEARSVLERRIELSN